MRLAFWRKGSDRAVAQRALPKPASVAAELIAPSPSGDLDLHALGQTLNRKRGWIIVPTILAFVVSLAVVNTVTPRYKSEARILIDGRGNVFLRPSGERNEERAALDPEAVTSQVQLLLSRDLAREIIKKNKLAERSEFDPVLQGFSPARSLLALFGIGRDPFSLTPEERVLEAYYDRFTAYAVDKSRVIVVEFHSRDPELAARVANSIAEGYLVLQQGARQEQARAASQWLAGEIHYLVDRLAATPEPGGDGTMLDHTLVMWTNELGKGNSHTLNDIPFVLIGGGCGFEMGRSLKLGGVPHNRLHLALAHAVGHPLEAFGKRDLCSGGPLVL
jgi:hypothetical protein